MNKQKRLKMYSFSDVRLTTFKQIILFPLDPTFLPPYENGFHLVKEEKFLADAFVCTKFCVNRSGFLLQ